MSISSDRSSSRASRVKKIQDGLIDQGKFMKALNSLDDDVVDIDVPPSWREDDGTREWSFPSTQKEAAS